MAANLGNWPSGREPISKIGPSDGCGGDAVPLAVERWYDFLEFGVIWEMSARTFTTAQLKRINALLPLIAAFDRIQILPGLSLIAVLEKLYTREDILP